MTTYKIKQKDEDFIVDEILDTNTEWSDNDSANNTNNDSNNEHKAFEKIPLFLLKKKNYNTLDALKIITERFHLKLKNIGFCGNKDKNAITTQYITIDYQCKKENAEINKDITLTYIKDVKNMLFKGAHYGNHFKITVRDLKLDKKETIKKLDKLKKEKIYFLNLFGEQRFSKNNADIGRAIIKKDYQNAAEMISKSNPEFKSEIENKLKSGQKINALQIVPLQILTIFIHAYQSLMWNNAAERLEANEKIQEKIKTNKDGQAFKIPLIGFGIELEEYDKIIQEELKKIMAEEQINVRDFIIREIPDLSSEGGEREQYCEIEELKYEILNDELNDDKTAIIFEFTLKKGSYATVAIEHLMRTIEQK